MQELSIRFSCGFDGGDKIAGPLDESTAICCWECGSRFFHHSCALGLNSLRNKNLRAAHVIRRHRDEIDLQLLGRDRLQVRHESDEFVWTCIQYQYQAEAASSERIP